MRTLRLPSVADDLEEHEIAPRTPGWSVGPTKEPPPVQGPAKGHNRQKRLDAQLAEWKQRAQIAEDTAARWRQLALDAQQDARQAHEALDAMLEAFGDDA